MFRKKKPSQLVKICAEALEGIETKDGKSLTKAIEELTKCAQAMKKILYGKDGKPPNPELMTQLTNEIIGQEILGNLISNLKYFEFESRKDVVQIFNNILHRKNGEKYPTVDYLLSKPEIIDVLFRGYENPDIALNTGMMIRECIQNEKLTEVILKSKNFEKFFDYVQLSDFDSASDAFTTLQSLLTKHPDVLSTFLTENYSRVIDKMNLLLKSENYVTARQTLKLLSEILLNRSNFKNMTRYISDVENLKLIMNLLRDPRKAIQFEAFQIFKLFVANPKKEDPIVKILAKNKEKLLSFLKQFHNDRDDDQFKEDKSILLKEVAKLPDLQ
eukprot:Anaeramoba_ignava/a351673_54.p1 GENE.a351673_54~~a351673_54.p1  ORF type:complete len:339 (-),score=110.48 a351673_54:20-1009(-)